MSDIVDLEVMGWCETVYELQREIESAPRADDVSRNDYRALVFALKELYAIVTEKLDTPKASDG